MTYKLKTPNYMFKLLLTAVVSFLQFILLAQSTDLGTLKKGIDITVKIPTCSSNKGKVYYGLYNSEENFRNKVPFQRIQSDIVDLKTEAVFKDVPAGTYAITCYHDANGNNQLDFESFMPLEDYGTSNNPLRFGPPQFKTSKFEVIDTNLTFEILF